MTRHEQAIDIEWAHCDKAGIVFYPRFYEWFDQATERLFKTVGLGYPELAARFGVLGMPLLESGARYENQCRLGDRIMLESWVDEWAARTFLVKHRVTHADGRPGLEGFERRVILVPDPDSAKGVKAAPIPADIRAALDAD